MIRLDQYQRYNFLLWKTEKMEEFEKKLDIFSENVSARVDAVPFDWWFEERIPSQGYGYYEYTGMTNGKIAKKNECEEKFLMVEIKVEFKKNMDIREVLDMFDEFKIESTENKRGNIFNKIVTVDKLYYEKEIYRYDQDKKETYYGNSEKRYSHTVLRLNILAIDLSDENTAKIMSFIENLL